VESWAARSSAVMGRQQMGSDFIGQTPCREMILPVPFKKARET